MDKKPIVYIAQANTEEQVTLRRGVLER